MHTVRLVFGLFCLVLFVYVTATVVWQYYHESTLTGWERWRATARDSATLFFNKIVIIVGALVGAFGQILDVVGAIVGDPNLKDQINSGLTQAGIDPKIIAGIVLSLTVGYYLTRMRSIPTPSGGQS